MEQPPIRDMARIQVGQSRCQITGTYVPVAEMNLRDRDRSGWDVTYPGDRIYVVPRALVYKDTSVQMNIHMERPASPRTQAGGTGTPTRAAFAPR